MSPPVGVLATRICGNRISDPDPMTPRTPDMMSKMSTVGAPTSKMINQVGTAPVPTASEGSEAGSMTADGGGEVTVERLAIAAQ